MSSSGAAMRVTSAGLLRGRDLTGEALLALEEDALVLSMPSHRVALPMSVIEGVRVAGEMLELYLVHGDVIQVSGPPALHEIADALARRTYVIPELTRSLRTMGSRRAAGSDHDRFFAPLLAARREAERAPHRDAACAAFDAAALRSALTERFAAFATERYPDEPPERRALEAELLEGAEALLARLDALEAAARTLAASSDAERFLRWREWSAALRRLFESADECWGALAAVLAPDRRGVVSRRRWKRRAARRRE